MKSSLRAIMIISEKKARVDFMDDTALGSSCDQSETMRLLDRLIDAALELKAHLADSNRDSNSLGGILIPQ